MTKQDFIWDVVVRITHWTTAALFLSNYFLTEEGSQLHQWVGYIVIAVISIRLLWGLIARSPARLSAFKPSVPKALEHLKEVLVTKKDEHVGHNPAGAIMIWLMWFLILSTAITGWLSETDWFWGEDWMVEIHEFFANATMGAVTIHVCAIILMSKLTQFAYVRTMLWRHKD
ncbi:cytochrome b/b6 domain-containing protein [Vibrio gazogenes]|uniref:Cytochrome b n=1 Tax=Vibrio gazogenes DSM 21264 = NBRC 103151 TaxID=1123492 RepID=A0A1M4XVK6_VIBGA|nr:cytochrome b/b6 domain-containing protein [Vibrio gazogenes]USP12872.1 cytochrome b/b6 domain-containing protein [Vibrio gazogenes]SHE97292.1 Cytochrome b [Vibrio gazogenes DSM 21264] [Vibrio gazogenes DSM 21264 = NBRC 103151]SJN57907.1 Prokaryotic cytochrome b561 [Vibrio gazogenes]